MLLTCETAFNQHYYAHSVSNTQVRPCLKSVTAHLIERNGEGLGRVRRDLAVTTVHQADVIALQSAHSSDEHRPNQLH